MKASTKLLSMLLILAMCLSLVSVTAFADSPVIIYVDDDSVFVGEEQPAEEPAEQPSEEPEQPAEEPEQPAEEPEKPAEEPEKPAEEPEKPAEQDFVPSEGTVAVILVKGAAPVEKGSFGEAIEAAPEGAVVKLIQDVDYSGTLVLGKDVSINLNGKYLDVNGSGDAALIAAADAHVSIYNGALLLEGAAQGLKAASGAVISLSGVRAIMDNGALFAASEGSFVVMSGRYSQDPSDFLADGYAVTENRSGLFTVAEVEQPDKGKEDAQGDKTEGGVNDPKKDAKPFQIGANKYDTLQDAIDAADAANNVIDMNKDSTESGVHTAPGKPGIILNMNGKTLTLSDAASLDGDGFSIVGGGGKIVGSVNVEGGEISLSGVTVEGTLSINASDSAVTLKCSDSSVVVNNLSVNLSKKTVNLKISAGSFGNLALVDGSNLGTRISGGKFPYTDTNKTDVENALKKLISDKNIVKDNSGYFTIGYAALKVVSSDGKTVFYDSADPSKTSAVSYFKGSASNNRDMVFVIATEQTWEHVTVKVFDQDNNLAYTLSSGDFSVSGKTLTIKKDAAFLKSLPAGIDYFRFLLSDGSSTTGSCAINIYVYPTLSSVSPSKRYVKSSAKDVTATLSDPCVKVGVAETADDLAKGKYTTLTEGTHYTRSGNSITLKSSYLDTLCNDDNEISKAFVFVYKIGGKEALVPLTLTLAPAPSIKPNPLVDNWTWKRGTDKSFTVKPNVTSVAIDGTLIDATNYTVKDNALTIKKGVVESLGYGNHTLTVTTKDGPATATFTMAPSLGYKVSNQHTKGGSKTLTYVASDQIMEVKVGEMVLAAGYHYMLQSDLKTFVITAEFLNTLDADKTYTISAVVKDTNGNLHTVTSTIRTLSSGSAGSNPKTGDENHLGLWAAVLLLSGGAVVALIPRKKKQ